MEPEPNTTPGEPFFPKNLRQQLSCGKYTRWHSILIGGHSSLYSGPVANAELVLVRALYKMKGEDLVYSPPYSVPIQSPTHDFVRD